MTDFQFAQLFTSCSDGVAACKLLTYRTKNFVKSRVLVQSNFLYLHTLLRKRGLSFNLYIKCFLASVSFYNLSCTIIFRNFDF